MSLYFIWIASVFSVPKKKNLAMTVHVARHCEEERRSNPEIKELF